MVKEILSQRGVSFQERDVSINNSYVQELVKSSGQMGVPVTIIDGQTVIGFDRGRLEQILNQRQTKQRPSFGGEYCRCQQNYGETGDRYNPRRLCGKC